MTLNLSNVHAPDSQMDTAFKILQKHEFPAKQTDYDKLYNKDPALKKQVQNMQKPCAYCKKMFKRNYRTAEEWEAAKYCSSLCDFNAREAIKTITKNNKTGKYKMISHEQKPCLNCSMMIERRNLNSLEWTEKKYCSGHCEKLHTERIKRMETKTHVHPQKVIKPDRKIPKKTCAQCGATFEKMDNESAYHFNLKKYCSTACRDENAKTKREQTAKEKALTTETKPCENCGKILEAKNYSPSDWKRRKFCSLECSNFGRFGKDKITPQIKEPLEKKSCLFCGKEISIKGLARSQWKTRKYCGKDCVYGHRRQLKEEGKSFYPLHQKPRTPNYKKGNGFSMGKPINKTLTTDPETGKEFVSCLVCGEPIPWKGRPRYRYIVQKTCSRDCRYKLAGQVNSERLKKLTAANPAKTEQPKQVKPAKPAKPIDKNEQAAKDERDQAAEAKPVKFPKPEESGLVISKDDLAEMIKDTVKSSMKELSPETKTEPAFMPPRIADFISASFVAQPEEKAQPNNLDLAELLISGGKYCKLLYPEGVNNENILPALSDLLDFLIKKQYLSSSQ